MKAVGTRQRIMEAHQYYPKKRWERRVKPDGSTVKLNGDYIISAGSNRMFKMCNGRIKEVYNGESIR